MKFSIPILLINTSAGILLFTILVFFSVWLGFPATEPKDSFNNALTFTGVVFSGSVTFGTAIIAAFLFNNWRDQHNKQVKNNLALAVYDSHKSLSKKIQEFSRDLSELQEVLSGYDYPVDHYLFSHEGNIIYLQNVANKKNEFDLIFHEFLSCLKSYMIIKGELNDYEKKYIEYFNFFTHANNYLLKINYLHEELNKYETIQIGYRDLVNILNNKEIEPLLIQLQA